MVCKVAGRCFRYAIGPDASFEIDLLYASVIKDWRWRNHSSNGTQTDRSGE